MKSFNSMVYALALAHSGLNHPGATGSASTTLRNKKIAVTVTEAGVLSDMRYDASGTGRFAECINVFDSLDASEGFALRFGGYGFFSSTNHDEEIVRGVLCPCIHPEDGREGVCWSFGSPRLLISHSFYLDPNEAGLDIVSMVRYCALQDSASGCMLIRSFNPCPDHPERRVEKIDVPNGETSLAVTIPECGAVMRLTGERGAQVSMLTDNGHEAIPDSFWVSGRVVDELDERRSGLQCLVSQRGYEARFEYRYVLQPVVMN